MNQTPLKVIMVDIARKLYDGSNTHVPRAVLSEMLKYDTSEKCGIDTWSKTFSSNERVYSR
jgi:hypothetical protein